LYASGDVPGREVKNMKTATIFALAMLMTATLLTGMTNANSMADVTTDKKEYYPGEQVAITITNNCRGDLLLNGYIIEDEKGEYVYSPPILAFPTILGSGETYSYFWKQTVYDGTEAAPGLYTVKIDQDSVQITILDPELPKVDIVTDQAKYISGESVSVIITNIGQVDIYSVSYWIEDAKGTVIYTPRVAFYSLPIAPGESAEYLWNQIDDSGNPVAPDTYAVCSYQDRTEISIFQGPVIELAVEKTVFELGETVLATLTNTGDMPIVVSNAFTVKAHNGKIVYTSNVLAFLRPLYPGTSIECAWDQIDDEGNMVDPGTYTIITEQGEVTIEIDETQDILLPEPEMHSDIRVDVHVQPSPIVPKPHQPRIRA
jgi:hypothetical protein